MLEALRAWQGYGFVGPVRPDHVPLLEGEEGHATGEKAVVRRMPGSEVHVPGFLATLLL